MITISEFVYKNTETRIKIHHPISREDFKLLKTILGFSYSKTYLCWYIPKQPNSIAQLKKLFPNIKYIKTPIKEKKKIEKQTVHFVIDKEKGVFYVKNFFNNKIFDKLKTFESSFWQKDKKQWIIKGTNENFLAAKKIFKLYNYEINIEYKKNLLEIEKDPKVRVFLEALKMKNYSISTVECYLPHFKEFVENFKNEDIDKLSLSKIKEYVADTINFKEFSEIQSKHLISSIKFYYEKVLGKSKIYFTLSKKYSFTEDDFKIPFSQIIPFLNKFNDNRLKLLSFLYFSCNFSSEKIKNLSLQELKLLLNDNENENYYKKLRQIIIDYYKDFKPQNYVFEFENKKLSSEKLLKLIEKTERTEFAIIRYKNIISKTGFSDNTCINYISNFKVFLKYFGFKHPKNITNIEIKKYLIDCKEKLKLSSSYINNQINTIKFYYFNIEKRKIEQQFLFRPKREKKLPTVLSPNEIFEMLNVTDNIKHKNLIALLYASGLRRNELLNLKVSDIDFAREVIIIRNGKGKKDRQTLLSENSKIILLKYLEEYKPVGYLFAGATGGKYSESSLEKVVKVAAQKAKIQKRVTPHTLRHSFATHLLENSVDIRYIQELLGHNSIKTTERYTHVANRVKNKIKSPLDNLNLKKK